MSQINVTVEQLNQINTLDIVTSPLVRDKFIDIYNTLWGSDTGETAYERESSFFVKLLREKPELQRGTHFSIFTAFIDLAICGLSLEPGTRALAYLMGRNVNVGTKDRPAWEGRVVLTVSAYGELVMRIRAGQIRHADNPVLVYANDEFSFADRGGRKEVDYVCHLPHTNQDIIACYIRITRADGTIDYAIMTETDWQRLKDYSAMQDRRTHEANKLYYANGGKIDPGFLMAKCIKHAFKTYPKVRIGRGTELQTQQTEEKEIEINDALYGVGNQIDETPQEPAQFGPQANDISAGVQVDTGEDDGF